jgi:hypothetical protein
LIVVFIVIFSFNVIADDRLKFSGGKGDIIELFDLNDIESSRIKANGNIKIEDGKCSGALIISVKATDVDGKKIEFKLKLKPKAKDCDFDGNNLALTDEANIVYETRNSGKRGIIGIDPRGYYQYGRIGREDVKKVELEEEVTVNIDLDNGLMDIYNEDFRIENIEI